MNAGRAIQALRAFSVPLRRHVHDRCELCAAPLDEHLHPHLLERRERRIACACEACASCFAGAPRWARVEPDAKELDLRLEPGEWDALGVPVRLAFFTLATRGTDVAEPLALLPSAAGTIESPLPGEAWTDACTKHPQLASLRPDVEGILAWHLGPTPRALRMSIDHVFRVAASLRGETRSRAADLDRLLVEQTRLVLASRGAR